MIPKTEGHVYWLSTGDFEGAGVVAHDLLESEGHQVISGGGILGDVHSSKSRVEYVVDRPLSVEERMRYSKLGFPLIEASVDSL